VREKPRQFFKDNPSIFSVEIDHGDFIARYGEIVPDKNLTKGSFVMKGQVIGIVADLPNVRFGTHDMLHFEMFSKLATGPLTPEQPSKNKFSRRSDLMDPTDFLNRTRQITFDLCNKPRKYRIYPHEKILQSGL
jgi:murein DD-endopeptidase MepM/ murein hydrolase activator NlpD